MKVKQGGAVCIPYRKAQEKEVWADSMSEEMRQAMVGWIRAYHEAAITTERDASGRWPYLIVEALYRAMFSEYTCTVGGEGEKAAGMRKAAGALDEVKAAAVKKAMICGSFCLKPCVVGDEIHFMPIPRLNVAVMERDGRGRPKYIGLMEEFAVQGRRYTLRETRRALGGGRLKVQNRINEFGPGGREVPPGEVPGYEALCPEVELALPFDTTGVVFMRSPVGNCVDGTNEGVSVYAPVVERIEQLYQLAAVCKQVQAGQTKAGKARWWARDSERHAVEAEGLRQKMIERRKAELLREIEAAVGLTPGSLSGEVWFPAQQALPGEAVWQLRDMWCGAAAECMRLADWMGQAYLGWRPGGYEGPAFRFDGR